MQLFRFSNLQSRQGNKELVGCWLVSESLGALATSRRGYCNCCGEVEAFEGGDAREGYQCPKCRLNARVRATFGVFADLTPQAGAVYLTEQSTSAFAWMQRHYPDVRGSEFEPNPEKRKALAHNLALLGGQGEIAFEDVTGLSFENESLDAVLSLDVLEHVPDCRAAFSEFARVLRPGGVLLATFPFIDSEATLVRASLNSDGSIQHHVTPEYHGDPIGGPVLCFYHFGWDVLDWVRNAGFTSAEMVLPWAPEQGVLYGHWTLLATR